MSVRLNPFVNAFPSSFLSSCQPVHLSVSLSNSGSKSEMKSICRQMQKKRSTRISSLEGNQVVEMTNDVYEMDQKRHHFFLGFCRGKRLQSSIAIRARKHIYSESVKSMIPSTPFLTPQNSQGRPLAPKEQLVCF